MSLVLKHWKVILIVVGILIALAWIGSVTGTNRKLLNMALDQIRTDQGKVVKTLEETVTQREYEIADLQRQQIQVRAENERLKRRLDEIQIQREAIIVSGDPDHIVAELRRLGFSSASRIKR